MVVIWYVLGQKYWSWSLGLGQLNGLNLLFDWAVFLFLLGLVCWVVAN